MAARSWCPPYLSVSVLDVLGFLAKNYCLSHRELLSFSGLYWRIHMIDMMPAFIWFILVTLGSTYLIAFAYKNTKFILKHKVCTLYKK